MKSIIAGSLCRSDALTSRASLRCCVIRVARSAYAAAQARPLQFAGNNFAKLRKDQRNFYGKMSVGLSRRPSNGSQ